MGMPLLVTVLGLWLFEPLLTSNLLFDLTRWGAQLREKVALGHLVVMFRDASPTPLATMACDALQKPVGIRLCSRSPFGMLPFGMLPRHVLACNGNIEFIPGPYWPFSLVGTWSPKQLRSRSATGIMGCGA